jgi:hypothetical protein
MYLSSCLSISLSIYLSVFIVYLSVFMVYLSIYPLSLSVYLSTCPSISIYPLSLSIYPLSLSIYLPVCLSIYLSIYLPFHLFITLPNCLFSFLLTFFFRFSSYLIHTVYEGEYMSVNLHLMCVCFKLSVYTHNESRSVTKYKCVLCNAPVSCWKTHGRQRKRTAEIDSVSRHSASHEYETEVFSVTRLKLKHWLDVSTNRESRHGFSLSVVLLPPVYDESDGNKVDEVLHSCNI